MCDGSRERLVDVVKIAECMIAGESWGRTEDVVAVALFDLFWVELCLLGVHFLGGVLGFWRW